MKFGVAPVGEVVGAILAHSVQVQGSKLRKGLTLTAAHQDQLAAAGYDEITVAQLEDGDCHEDKAAGMLAAALAPDAKSAGLRITPPFTGRVNLLADGPGVVVLEAEALQAFNCVNPMITVATVPQYQQMGPGGMIATIKVISYAVPREDVVKASDLAQASIRLAAPVHKTAGLIVTDIGRSAKRKRDRSHSWPCRGVGNGSE